MRNHYLVCEKCKKSEFLGQGYGVVQICGNKKENITQFILEHFDHGIEILDENDLFELIIDKDHKSCKFEDTCDKSQHYFCDQLCEDYHPINNCEILQSVCANCISEVCPIALKNSDENEGFCFRKARK